MVVIALGFYRKTFPISHLKYVQVLMRTVVEDWRKEIIAILHYEVSGFSRGTQRQTCLLVRDLLGESMPWKDSMAGAPRRVQASLDKQGFPNLGLRGGVAHAM